jgi:hypothetical protein
MQNVATRRRDRINSDEEERVRIGYEIKTGVRFARRSGAVSAQQATLAGEGGEPLATLVYGHAATIWRMNLGWRRRRNREELGYLLDIERGIWARNESQGADEDPDDPMSPRRERVIPYVEDHRNCLLVEPALPLDQAVMASLASALKAAIQVHFQLEDRELAAEPLPSSDDRRVILLYEASEGGAGVLRRLVEERRALKEVARIALDLCHYDPATRKDLLRAPRAREDCEAACYDCLLLVLQSARSPAPRPQAAPGPALPLEERRGRDLTRATASRRAGRAPDAAHRLGARAPLSAHDRADGPQAALGRAAAHRELPGAS